MPWPWSSSISRTSGCSGSTARRARARVALTAAPVGFCARSVTIRARAPAARAPAHVVRQRPLVVHAHRGRAQPERRDQVEQAAPARVLDGDGVARLEVGREHALDGVERAGGDGERARPGTPSASKRRAREARQLRVHGRLPVQDRLPVALLARPPRTPRPAGAAARGRGCRSPRPAPRPARPPGCSSRAGGRGLRPHPAAPAPGGLDDPPLAQGAVGGRDRVGIHPQLDRQLPHRRQQLTRLQLAGAHRALDARRNLRCAPTLRSDILLAQSRLCTSAMENAHAGRIQPDRRPPPTRLHADRPHRPHPLPRAGPRTTRNWCTRYSTRATSATSASSATARRSCCPRCTRRVGEPALRPRLDGLAPAADDRRRPTRGCRCA